MSDWGSVAHRCEGGGGRQKLLIGPGMTSIPIDASASHRKGLVFLTRNMEKTYISSSIRIYVRKYRLGRYHYLKPTHTVAQHFA